MSAVAVGSLPPDDWDDYVRSHSGARIYHESHWARLAQRLFGYHAYFLTSRDGAGRLRGVLPLVRQKGGLGSFLVSLPYFNYCGVLADDEATRTSLIEAAFRLGREQRVKYVQLREEQPAGVAGVESKTDKVAMRLALPDSTEAFGKALGSKLRSQVRRAERENVQTRHGGRELLGDFYTVFCSVMRDLGTPVYPKKFFEGVIEAAGDRATIVVVDLDGVPSAAGFLLGYRDKVEIPWAGTVAAAKPKSVNMKLYWDVLSLAIERGFKEFDFGRSSADGGTYKFKAQWGAKPVQLYWHEHNPRGATGTRSGRTLELATRVWSRMPLRATNWLGPLISPGLPW